MTDPLFSRGTIGIGRSPKLNKRRGCPCFLCNETQMLCASAHCLARKDLNGFLKGINLFCVHSAVRSDNVASSSALSFIVAASRPLSSPICLLFISSLSHCLACFRKSSW